MKYFAKYLPVEGEIKEGDYVLGGPGDEAEGEIWQHDGSGHISEEDKKVKLFLCSRDIKYLDKVRDDAGNELLYEGSDTNLNSEFYKVIAEISPSELHVVTDEFEGIHHKGLTGEFIQMSNGGYCIPVIKPRYDCMKCTAGGAKCCEDPKFLIK